MPPSIGPRSAAVPEKTEPRVLTVAQLSRVVVRTLERSFGESVFVEGEISGARPASSGHVYFALKDEAEDATLDVVLYRSSITPRARSLIKDGARVRIRGKPTYWAPRGKLQFVGDRVEPTGKGALLEALEKLKAKLQAEGLFAPERKRKLPADPRIVGVVTSASGAVIHDICKVAFRRGGAKILLAPAQVQGAGAVESVRRALRMLAKIRGVDVVIVARGGGSQDDLLAFHDEDLVRDVAAYPVPIVSAVGHEVDVTLVDFAADARAATPSQAAELVVPDAVARRHLLEERTSRLRRAMYGIITEERAAAANLAQRFGDPRLLIATAQQRIDEANVRLEKALGRQLAASREASAHLAKRLGAAHPRERIARDSARIAEHAARIVHLTEKRVADASRTKADLATRLQNAGRDPFADRRRTLDDLGVRHVRAVRERSVHDRRMIAELAGRLDAMSPLAVLARGYAITTKDGHAVRDAAEVTAGDRVRVQVARGSFDAAVIATTPAPPPADDEGEG